MKYADTPPRKKVGQCDFNCPNPECGKPHHRAIWEERPKSPDVDEILIVHADALCSCGAQILVADDLESFKIFWLNERKMKSQNLEWEALQRA